ncbi:MAG: hypothetical protein V1859_02340 [archaeon]
MKSSNITLSKSMIRTLIEVVRGNNSMALLEKKLNSSKSWTTRVINKLQEFGFIKKNKNGISLRLELADSSHAIAFKDMFVEQPNKNYEDILSGRNLDVLLAIVTGEKNTKIIGKMLSVQPRVVRLRINFLAGSGLINKSMHKYSISNTQEYLIKFLKEIRNYSKYNGRLIWKFGIECLIKVLSESDMEGETTGMNRYKDFEIPVNTVYYMCYKGHDKISVSLAFIHSLFEINDARTTAIAITYFAKNKLFLKENFNKMHDTSEKYDKSSIVDEIMLIYNSVKKWQKIKSSLLPFADYKEIEKQFELYGVKNV